MASWLRNQKKGELQALSEAAGLKTTSSMKKDDLVELVDEHLRTHASQYSANPTFAEYYKRGVSPQKKPRASTTTEGAEEEKPEVKKRRKTISKEVKEAAGESESAVIPRTPGSLQRLASSVRLPTSPALNRVVSRQTSWASAQYKKFLKTSDVKAKVALYRQTLSSVEAIQLLILIFEAAGLRRFTMPIVTTQTPELPGMKVKPYDVPVPQITNLITSNFWAPTTLWLLTSLLVPGAVSYFINLTYANPRPKTRRTVPKREFDPLVFSVVKALIVWVVYPPGASFRFFSAYTDSTVDVINTYVYGGYVTMIITAFVGIVTSIADYLSFKS